MKKKQFIQTLPSIATQKVKPNKIQSIRALITKNKTILIKKKNQNLVNKGLKLF